MHGRRRRARRRARAWGVCVGGARLSADGLASALHAVCLVGFTLAPSPQAATALYCLMTATMSMVQSAFFGTYLDVGGKQVGLLMSIGNTVANVPGVLVPVVGAFVRQRFGSFTPLFVAVAAVHAASAVVFRRTIA